MTKSSLLQRLSATVQFILGFALGISLIAGVSGAFVFAYYKKMSTLPKKPVYSGVPAPESAAKPASTPTIQPIESNTAENAVAELELEPESEPEPEPEPEPLPANAYRAEVTWPEGLSLRAEPDIEADRIGGIAFEDSIIILEDSNDAAWQKVRLSNGQEGWVKGGNTERTSEEDF